MLAAGQIYFIPKVDLGKADYGRPCLVLRASKHDATVCFFSTKIEYREPGEVAIHAADADFKASGLRDSSYIADDLTQDVKLDYFKGAKLLGRATGEFKKRVEDWYGLPLN
jgi:hypothetical protein